MPYGTVSVPYGTVCVPNCAVRHSCEFPVFASSQQAENVDGVGSLALPFAAERNKLLPMPLSPKNKNQERDWRLLSAPIPYINRSNPTEKQLENLRENHETLPLNPLSNTLYLLQIISIAISNLQKINQAFSRSKTQIKVHPLFFGSKPCDNRSKFVNTRTFNPPHHHTRVK